MLSMTDLQKEWLRDLTQRCRQGRVEGRRRRRRRELGSGSPPRTFRVSSAALSLPGGPGRVSVCRLAPVPKLGRLVTHEGTAADRLEPLLLESVPSCSAASSSRRPGAADRLPRCSGFAFPHSLPPHTAPHLSFFVLPYLSVGCSLH